MGAMSYCHPKESTTCSNPKVTPPVLALNLGGVTFFRIHLLLEMGPLSVSYATDRDKMEAERKTKADCTSRIFNTLRGAFFCLLKPQLWSTDKGST